jgi:hypothetical protein
MIAASTLLLACSTLPVSGFGVTKTNLPISQNVASRSKSAQFMSENDASMLPEYVESEEDEITNPSLPSKIIKPEAIVVKKELLELAERTNRGFQASASDRKRARELIFDLARFNPTPEPASPYYTKANDSNNGDQETEPPTSTLAGKWTLIFTDAPDITGLDTSRNPFSTAKLGRIGQECKPPYIKKVIEWRRPDWAKDLPLSGSDESRVLQKVVTSASATPDKPLMVDLKVAGLELEAGSNSDEETNSSSAGEPESDIASRIQKQGIPAGLLSMNPVDLKGSWNPPFGQFEILYLDEDLRMIKTGQNYVAVNRRIQEGEEWF